ncbi:MAG: hypothetical protein ACT4P7_04920 [Gemmatimonadaceae bacterium]
MWELRWDAATVSFAAVSVFILLWDVLLAGQIAQARRQARDFLAITALCGLFVAPAAVIALAAASAYTGRTVSPVAWLWPATLGLFAVQSGLALRRQLVTSLISVPVFAFNLLLFVAAVARTATTWWVGVPAGFLGVEVAQTSTMGLVWHTSAMWSPLAVQLPLLAPAYPARWQVSKTLRAGLAIGAAAWTLLAAVEFPSAVRAVVTFADLTNEPLRERPRGDLALGVRILPVLRGPPSATALERDLPLADSLGAGILSVVVAPAGASALALDSLASALAGLRRDSILLVISLDHDREDRDRFLASPVAYMERRLALVDRVVRRVRPDVLLPALDPFDAGVRALGSVPLGWWTEYHARAADLAHRLRPRTRVGVAFSAFTRDDSLLYAWAARDSSIDLLAFSFAPTFRGGASLAARLRTAERWMRDQPKLHWVVSVRTYPYVFGEAAQQSALAGTLAWASRRPRVHAVIVDGAGDYDVLTGLQRADGGLRPAVATLARAQRALREAAQ